MSGNRGGVKLLRNFVDSSSPDPGKYSPQSTLYTFFRPGRDREVKRIKFSCVLSLTALPPEYYGGPASGDISS